MIVTFSSTAHGSITYHGDVALDLLRFMGRDDTIPSAMYSTDIPEALAKLKAAVETSDLENDSNDNDSSAHDAEPVVKLHQRALPLVQLLEAARDADVPVMWDS